MPDNKPPKKKAPLVKIEQVLNDAEMRLYHRHVEDGMDFHSLAAEFNTDSMILAVDFKMIENKLREAFRNA